MRRVEQGVVLAAAAAMCFAVAMTGYLRTHRNVLIQQQLYNKWGTNDNNDHWGGVGSENYHTAKWDNTGSNVDYHPRDSSSGDGDSMEPAWWRNGPGANSEYTGHAMDGELYSPPDEKIFKPFFMKQQGVRASQLFDVDGPSPSDLPPSAWAAAGRGTTDWMLRNEGPLLASTQEQMPRDHLSRASHRAQTATAQQVFRAEHPLAPGQAKKLFGRHAPAGAGAGGMRYSGRGLSLEEKGLHFKIISDQQAHAAAAAGAEHAHAHKQSHKEGSQKQSSAKGGTAAELMSDRQKAMQKALGAHQAELEKQRDAHQKEVAAQQQSKPKSKTKTQTQQGSAKKGAAKPQPEAA